MNIETQKPSYKEWLDWAQVIVDRLTVCVHGYSKPLYDDVFMPEKERQDRNAVTLALLRRIHGIADEAETKGLNETSVVELASLMRDVAEMLPVLSGDMQKLMKSPWFDMCNGMVANILFRGERPNHVDGIGSGFAEHGRLPEVLANLVERERTGEPRKITAAAHPHPPQHEEMAFDNEGPQRHTPTTHDRWVNANGGTLRSAGRVE